MSKNGNPFCSKLLHFAFRCQCKCKAKCSNYYILQRYYILGCDRALQMNYYIYRELSNWIRDRANEIAKLFNFSAIQLERSLILFKDK